MSESVGSLLGESWVEVDDIASHADVGYFAKPPAPTANVRTVRLIGSEQVANLLRQKLLEADTFEPYGALNNVPPDLGAANAEIYPGLAKQFCKDAHRQSVYVETKDRLGDRHRVPLGTLTAAAAADPTLITLESMAEHLLLLCGGDVRWRFQASQILNQTLPNAVGVSLYEARGLQIGTYTVTMGMPSENFFELRRRSSTRFEIKHTSIWRWPPTNNDVGAPLPTRPFFLDAEGKVHRFTGQLMQITNVRLKRPQNPAVAPRLGDVKVDVTGSVGVIDEQPA